jgi:alkanesulfonate monooxygenase SsuD/methylene tetrahydromethanopterin reductase-like flavin-dependent oxidoreductase (luciferase family)
VRIGFRTSPQKTDWASLDAAWAEAGRHDVFDSGWLNDHLTDPGFDRGGASFESMTALAALAHHVPGKTVGQTVLAATFRHPSVLAKQALTLDHVTGGRYILALGAGWHVGEHEAFGIDLLPPGPRFDRFEAAVRVIKALFNDAARAAPGVTLDAPPFRLDGATMEPAPVRPGGPPLWLGGQGPRGLRIAARYADGWNFA